MMKLERKKPLTQGMGSILRRELMMKIYNLLEEEERLLEKSTGFNPQKSNLIYVQGLKESLLCHVKPKAELVNENIILDEKLVEALHDCDFTPTEAKFYAYFIQQKKPMSIPSVSQKLGCPRTEAYHVMNKLIARGLITGEPWLSEKFSRSGLPACMYFIIEPNIAFRDWFMAEDKEKENNRTILIQQLKRFT